MSRSSILLYSLVMIGILLSCRSKKEPVAYNYKPVFDQTNKSYARTSDLSLARLDTSVLIRSNLRSEVVNCDMTISFSLSLTYKEVELIADLSEINEKPPKYDTSLVVGDLLYRREWAEGLFPERSDSFYVVTDPLGYGSDPTEQFRDRDIFNKQFLTRREIMMFQNRDFSLADSLFAAAAESAPFSIGEVIPYQEGINLLYFDGNVCLQFDTIYTPYRVPIVQLPIDKLMRIQSVRTDFPDSFVYFDQVEFLRYFPEDEDVYVDMVRVQGGNFKMGSNEFDEDEKPATILSVSSFLIGKYEVSNKLFCYYLNDKRDGHELSVKPDGTLDGVLQIDLANRYTKIVYVRDSLKFLPVKGYENHPVVNVTWYGAQGFALFAVPIDEKKRNPRGGRLPTEAEWEYAARGGVYARKELNPRSPNDFEYVNRFAGGNYMTELGYFVDNSYGYCQPVGNLKPNELGIYDLCGNVWEWCYDRYDPEFLRNVGGSRDPMSKNGSIASRVVKGGSWSSDAMYCRITNRNSSNVESCNPYLGFRLWKKW